MKFAKIYSNNKVMGTKVCTECKIPKDREHDFHVCKKTFDGRQAKCKVCRNKNNNKYIKTDWLKMVIG